MRQFKFVVVLFIFLCPVFILAQTPDITQTNGDWSYGWGTSGGENFSDFGQIGSYSSGSPVKKLSKEGWWSAAQNTTDNKWVDAKNSVTFPPKSIGAIALHPGSKSNQYAKVRYTAPTSGQYNISVKFEALDAQFSKAKAEIWTNSGGSWKRQDLISLTKKAYDNNHKKIEKKFPITLKKGEIISVELECDGNYSNDFTLVTLEAKKKANDIPDITQTDSQWTYGWGTSGGENFSDFGKPTTYSSGSPVKKLSQKGWWSAAQNTSNTQWQDVKNSVTFPPKSFGAIALHPGSKRNEYAKVRFTAPVDGQYVFDVRFEALDAQFTKAKAEVWTNSGGSWKRQELISLTKKAYDDNYKKIDKKYTINLKKGEIISIELENDGDYSNDYTQVTIGVNNK